MRKRPRKIESKSESMNNLHGFRSKESSPPPLRPKGRFDIIWADEYERLEKHNEET